MISSDVVEAPRAVCRCVVDEHENEKEDDDATKDVEPAEEPDVGERNANDVVPTANSADKVKQSTLMVYRFE